MMTRTLAGTMAVLALALLGGCDSGRGGGMFASEPCLCRVMPGLVKSQVFQAALAEMRLCGGVSQSDQAAGVIVGQPQYLSRDAGESAQQFRVISSPADLRRQVRVTIGERPRGVQVQVCVAVQRRDTASAQQYQALRDPGDVPNEVPLSAFSREMDHREVWKTVSRDHQAEEALMTAIECFFKPPTTQPGA